MTRPRDQRRDEHEWDVVPSYVRVCRRCGGVRIEFKVGGRTIVKRTKHRTGRCRKALRLTS